MSFWGLSVSAAQPKKVGEVNAKEGELVHLSQACLAPDAKDGASAKLMVKQEGVAYCVACLKEGVTESCSLDLFLNSKEAEFIVKGNASVHVTGYLEGEDMDDEEEEEVTKSKPAPSPKVAPVASSP